MVSDRFGRRAMGAAYGLLIFFATGLGGSVGPILVGYIYDKTGSFDLGWLICIFALIIVAVAMLALKPKNPALRRSWQKQRLS
jgi:MFS family permease